MNKTFPDGKGTEGHNRTIDNAFRPDSEHDMDTAFVTDHREQNRI